MGVLFWISYGVLWIALACTITAILFLYRYLGQRELNSREGRSRQGPSYGQPIPLAKLIDLRGSQLTLGPAPRPRLVYFASIACKNCTEALPTLSRFASQQTDVIETVLVCWGSMRQSQAFTAECASAVRVVADPAWELGTKLRVSSTPFAVVIDPRGVVRAKGSPTTRDEFEALIEHVTTPAQPIVFKPTTNGDVAVAVEGD